MMNAQETRLLTKLATQKPDITHLIKDIDVEIYHACIEGKSFLDFVLQRITNLRFY